jgi:hypothetical protein
MQQDANNQLYDERCSHYQSQRRHIVNTERYRLVDPLGPTKEPVQCVPGALSWGGGGLKELERDHLFPVSGFEMNGALHRCTPWNGAQTQGQFHVRGSKVSEMRMLGSA